jgi:hypothetical protein
VWLALGVATAGREDVEAAGPEFAIDICPRVGDELDREFLLGGHGPDKRDRETLRSIARLEEGQWLGVGLNADTQRRGGGRVDRSGERGPSNG